MHFACPCAVATGAVAARQHPSCFNSCERVHAKHQPIAFGRNGKKTFSDGHCIVPCTEARCLQCGTKQCRVGIVKIQGIKIPIMLCDIDELIGFGQLGAELIIVELSVISYCSKGTCL